MMVYKRRVICALAALVMMVSMLPGVPAAAQGRRYSAIGHFFGETGQALGGLFWDYWNQHGGLAQQGYPISQELAEISETDGQVYLVQYFERAVFEYHPENAPPNNVLLSLLGNFLYQQNYPNGAPNQRPNTSAGSTLFRETGKRLGGRFLAYWRANGGLAQQGFPISDEFMETSPLDGNTYLVQYFERAVFEYHPENPPAFQVLLSQLGTFRYQTNYPATGPQGDVDGDFIADEGDNCPQAAENINDVFDLDGCPDTMQTLLIYAAEDINAFWINEFREAGVRYDPPADFVAYNSEIQTACGSALLNNAFYCGPAHGIYYHFDFLQEQLDTDGDFAPVTILAHEWGHLVQGNLGLLGGQFYTIQTELQADCFAGAWAASAGERNLLDEGDLEEGATSLFRAGDDLDTPWFEPGAHGQPEQRIDAFVIGLEQGTDGCFGEGAFR
jgi:hypothetical protein